MHFPSRYSKLNLYNRKIHKSIGEFQRRLSLSDTSWRNILKISKKEFQNIQEKKKAIGIESIISLAEHFDLTLEAILKNQVDFPTLIAHMNGDFSYIPDQYLTAAFSRRKTVRNFLDFSERYFGYELREKILRRFQITEAAFTDPEAPINVKFIMKLFDFLSEAGLQKQHFYLLGTHTLVTYKNTSLSQELSKISTPVSLFEQFVDRFAHHYEKNCVYRILSLDESRCVIQSIDNRDIADALKLRKIGNIHGCQFKTGIFASLTGFIGLGISPVRELSCIHRGDSDCQFEINLRRANTLAETQLIH